MPPASPEASNTLRVVVSCTIVISYITYIGFLFSGKFMMEAWNSAHIHVYIRDVYHNKETGKGNICYLKAFFGNWYSLLYVGMRVIESSKVKNCVLMTNKKKECLGNNKIQNVGKTKLSQLSVYFITVYSTSRIYIFGVFILVFFKTATNKQHCVYSYKHIH